MRTSVAMTPDISLRSCLLLLPSVLSLIAGTDAFYVPGYSIKSYRDGESIPLLVNKIFSDTSSLQYAYYELPFVCPPTGHKHGGSPFASGYSSPLNLGEILRGDRIAFSDFDLEMRRDVECQALCSLQIGRKDVKWTRELVAQSYLAEWIVDNLPGATSFVTVDKSQKYYSTGFKIGYQDFSDGKPRFFLNNHFTFVIRWRRAPGSAGDDGGRVIVGFEVYPKSFGNKVERLNGCPADLRSEQPGLELYVPQNRTRLAEQYPSSSYLPEEDELDDGAMLSITHSYSVYFREEPNIEWHNRWDLYFTNQQEGKRTHWLAIVNSLIISGFLGVSVLVIWGRTVQGDIRGRGDGVAEDGLIFRSRKSGLKSPRPDGDLSNGLLEVEGGEKIDVESLLDEEMEEVAPWKRLHGDVFRIPPYAGLLAPIIGSGMQLLIMAAGLLLLSCFGILNPSFRGGFVSVGIALFIVAGAFSGYFSARLYRTFAGQNFLKNTLLTALLFPGLLFWFIFVLNLFVWAQASSTAIPFSTLIALVALWLLIQLPLVYAGSWFGSRRAKPWEHPTRTNPIPRQIPLQPWYMRVVQKTLLTGFVPFAVLFVELLFVFKSLVQDKSGYYYVFGYFSIVCAILIVTVAEVTIISTYSQLCAENHNWWWHSFLSGGSSSLWIFMYCIWYFFAKLKVQGFISGFLFFSYSFLGCAVYGLLTGTVGFLTAYAFIRRIYSSVKVD